MIRPASILAAALLSAVTARAQQNVEQTPQPWTKWDLATGDWNRNRPALEDRGTKFFTTYTSQVWGNVAGGVQRGATYTGVMQFGLELDFEKMHGWKGTSFNTTWVWIAGGSQTPYLTGALFPSSGAEGPAGFRALDLWLQQKFFDDVLTVRAGLFNADRDFTISEGCQLMLNSATGWPLIYDGKLGGPPAYPLASPGIYVALEPGGGWKFQAAAMQGIVWPPAENPTNFYWRFTRDNGVLFLGEAQYEWKGAALPGTAKLGAMFETGSPDYVDQDGGAWGGSFFYGIIDQMLWREPGTDADSSQGFAWYNRTGFGGTPNRDPLGMLFNSGLTWTGLIEGRDDDAIGLGVVWTRLTPGQAAQLEGSNRGNEFVVEATYEAQLTPWFELQPDIQFVIQPGGSTALANALVIGLSATIDF
jgi:porin